jgi:hypothetical protein
VEAGQMRRGATIGMGDAAVGGGQDPAQIFALIVGVVYLAIGVLGFAATGTAGFVDDGTDKVIGFDLNGFHNVVHIGVGLFLLAVSRLRDPVITQGVLIGGGLVYIVAAFLGFTNNAQILSIDDSVAPDNFLHLFSGLAALIVGLASAAGTEPRPIDASIEPRVVPRTRPGAPTAAAVADTDSSAAGGPREDVPYRWRR